MKIFHKVFKIYFIIAFLVLLVSSSFAQDDKSSSGTTDSSSSLKSFKLKPIKDNPIDKNNINFVKFGAITGVTAGAFIWLHNYQANSWWKDQRGSFHVSNDWDYAMSADKLGHFFDGAFVQALYQGAFEWAGFKKTTAMWIATGFSVAYMTDIEIEDGFARDWGFSPGDQLGNVLGAFYPVAQYYWDPLKNFNFKWSYYPSEELRNGNKNGVFLDDYNGQTMWLSMDVHNMLPAKAQNYWPDIFNIVLGYGVDNYTNYETRYANYYIGLDLNWQKIIPGNSKFMTWFKNVISHFRFLPLPAIRFNKHETRYVVNF